jgi:hypothetical protein
MSFLSGVSVCRKKNIVCSFDRNQSNFALNLKLKATISSYFWVGSIPTCSRQDDLAALPEKEYYL